METLKKLLLTFVLVLTGYTVSTAIFISIFYKGYEFSILLIWEIIALSAICTLGNFIFYSKREISKEQMKLRKILHFIYINSVVLGGALALRWIDTSLLGHFLLMLVLIAGVYFIVMAFNIRQEKKAADHMNQLLRKLNSTEQDKEE